MLSLYFDFLCCSLCIGGGGGGEGGGGGGVKRQALNVIGLRYLEFLIAKLLFIGVSNISNPVRM